MKKIINIVSMILSFTIFMCSTFTVTAQSSNINYDDFLLSIGCPANIIAQISNEQKQYIYETSVGKNVEYCGYDSKDVSLISATNNQISPQALPLEDSELTLSFFATKTTSSGQTLYYSVYPTFTWNVARCIDNDSFSMAIYSGWSARPGERNLRLHIMQDGVSAGYTDLDPSASSEYGYSYNIPYVNGYLSTHYSGHAYYNIDKVSANAQPSISLHYTHDATPLVSTSYGITIGAGSISLNANSDHIKYKAENFYVAGLTY